MESNETEIKKCHFIVPDIDKEQFGSNLKKIRLAFEMKQKDLSIINRGDISEQTVSQWESGKKLPAIETFLNLCHFFTISPDKLLFAKVKVINLELREQFAQRYIRIINTMTENKDGTIDFGEEYIYYPEKYGKCHFPYFDHAEYLNLTYEECIQGYIHDLNATHLDSNHFYEGQVVWPKHRIQQFYCLVDDDKTRDKINSLLKDYKVSDDTLQALLSFKSIESIRRLKRGDQKWGIDLLYQLSWILDMPFEDLLVYKPLDYTQEYNDFFSKKTALLTQKSQPKSQVNKKVNSPPIDI